MPTGTEIAAVIVVIIIGVLLVAELFVMTALLLAMKNLVEEIRERIDPVITKANNLLITVNEMAETVQDKTEHIAGSAAHTTDVIGARMERTSGFMQQMVASPIIRGIAFTEGLGAGIATWRKLRRSRKA